MTDSARVPCSSWSILDDVGIELASQSRNLPVAHGARSMTGGARRHVGVRDAVLEDLAPGGDQIPRADAGGSGMQVPEVLGQRRTIAGLSTCATLNMMLLARRRSMKALSWFSRSRAAARRAAGWESIHDSPAPKGRGSPCNIRSWPERRSWRRWRHWRLDACAGRERRWRERPPARRARPAAVARCFPAILAVVLLRVMIATQIEASLEILT